MQEYQVTFFFKGDEGDANAVQELLAQAVEKELHVTVDAVVLEPRA